MPRMNERRHGRTFFQRRLRLRFVSLSLNKFNIMMMTMMMMIKCLTFTQYNITIKLLFFATLHLSMLSSNSTRHSESNCHNLQAIFVGLLRRWFIGIKLAVTWTKYESDHCCAVCLWLQIKNELSDKRQNFWFARNCLQAENTVTGPTVY